MFIDPADIDITNSDPNINKEYSNNISVINRFIDQPWTDKEKRRVIMIDEEYDTYSSEIIKILRSRGRRVRGIEIGCYSYIAIYNPKYKSNFIINMIDDLLYEFK